MWFDEDSYWYSTYKLYTYLTGWTWVHLIILQLMCFSTALLSWAQSKFEYQTSCNKVEDICNYKSMDTCLVGCFWIAIVIDLFWMADIWESNKLFLVVAAWVIGKRGWQTLSMVTNTSRYKLGLVALDFNPCIVPSIWFEKGVCKSVM